MFQVVVGFVVAYAVGRALKLALALGIVAGMIALVDSAIDAVVTYVNSLEDLEVLGYAVPAVSLAQYSGVFTMVSAILGAYVAVAVIKIAARAFSWL